LKWRGIIKGGERGREREKGEGRKKEGCRLSAAGMRDTLPVASCADGGYVSFAAPKESNQRKGAGC